MRYRSDQEAVSPVIATILMVAIVVVVSATVFFMTTKLSENGSGPAPHIAMTTDHGASTTAQWKLSFQSAVPPRATDQFLFVLRTPANGTLVADPALQPLTPVMDFYWELGTAAGDGVHNDDLDVVPPNGYGGYHLRLDDVDGDGRLGGGDRLTWWYDGDGDQGHVEGGDDAWPNGTYTLEIKHQRSDTYVAYDTRTF